ncbi:MAG: glycosyltransferase family 2 protein [Porticoccaceae bacterium]|nr:glycosyltransferase family 2 protein [Porticoccaceae bacterium]
MNVCSKPLVTVLVTSYNHQEFVAECIYSVIRQTYENIELIVIDDGSTDKSKSVIEEILEKHQFTFIPQENQGLAAVLNKGLSLGKGEYFVSIGSDDACMLDRIEKQVEFMESREDIAVCAGNCLVVDEQSFPEKKQSFNKPRELTFDNIYLHDKAGIKAPTAMCRADVMRQVGGYNPKIKLEDIYMWLKITNAGYGVYVLGDVLAFYRKHSGNQSKDMRFMADSLEAIYGEYSEHPQYKSMIKKLLTNLFAKSVRRGYPNSINLFKRIRLGQYNLKLMLSLALWLIKFPFVRLKLNPIN